MTNKGNGPMPKAGDEVRASAERIAQEADKALAAAREKLELLAKMIEELKATTAERFGLVASAAEMHIGKSEDAIKTIRGLIDMLKDINQPQSALPAPESVKAVEAALQDLRAKK